jgi:hypothetical protein
MSHAAPAGSRDEIVAFNHASERIAHTSPVEKVPLFLRNVQSKHHKYEANSAW